jgi:hypothetical protein
MWRTDASTGKAELRLYTGEAMLAIAALLPDRNRGPTPGGQQLTRRSSL